MLEYVLLYVFLSTFAGENEYVFEIDILLQFLEKII